MGRVWRWPAVFVLVAAAIGIGALLTGRSEAPEAAAALTLPDGFKDQPVASGISTAAALAIAPDGRIFVAQQTGELLVIKDGVLLETPFVTVTTDPSGERGLLGVAFDPDFESNHFVYVYYTVTTTPRHNRVSRFTASGDVAAADSEVPILDLEDLSTATNHNGGGIHFGPDGKLYVGVGENANGANSQSLTTRLGKMLRINKDGSIPSDNPFVGMAGARGEIWALGLRNPFTFAFQPGTGRMFINDVGASAWEEINDGMVASNYGWPITEGPTNDPAFVAPLFAYGHGRTGTTGCAISGGAFYNPAFEQFPESYRGKYFFADLCSSWIRVFDPETGTASAFAQAAVNPVDVAVGDDGALYYLSRGGGMVGRVTYGASITAAPNPCTIASGAFCTSTITWAAGFDARITVEDAAGGAEVTFAVGPSGNQLAPWIQAAPHEYVFRLYDISGSTPVLRNSVTVTGEVGPSDLISASPNPCEIPGGEFICTTEISWSAGGDAEVSVQVDNGAEQLFASGQSGVAEAPWIQGPPREYVFRLYEFEGASSVFRGSVTVTGEPESASISASPNPCEIPVGAFNCTTDISWDATGSAEVTVKLGDQAEQLFASGQSGVVEAPWIQGPPQEYVFRLYEFEGGSRVLRDSVTVTGESGSASILASPNPCTIPTGQSTCTTNISWIATGEAEVTVQRDSGAEQLLATGLIGVSQAPWIEGAPHQYIFRLYELIGSSRVLRDSVTVTGVQGATLTGPPASRQIAR